MTGVICTRLKVVLGMWLLQYAGSDLTPWLLQREAA